MGTGYLVELCEYRGRGKQLSRGGWARLAERRHCLRYHPDNKVFLPANKARATAQCHEVETAHVLLRSRLSLVTGPEWASPAN